MRSLLKAAALVLGTLEAVSYAHADDKAECSKRRGESAVVACDRLISTTKNLKELAPLHRNRCSALNDARHHERALADCDKAVRLNPKFAPAYSTRCWVRTDLRDLDRAMQDCDKAIQLDPNFGTGYNNRGSAWLVKGEGDRALKDFNDAIRLEPKSAIFFNNRCRAWNSKRDPDRAIADCDHAIKLDPRSPHPHVNRCVAWNYKGLPDRAVSDCSEAIKIGGKYAPAFAARCIAFSSKNELETAMADCDEAVALDPGSAPALNARCWLWHRKREPDRAIQDCNEALRINPRHIYAYNNRGLAWRAKRERDRAIADFSEAIRIDARYADPYLNRGLLHEEAGRLPEALADFQSVMRLDPNRKGANERLRRVEQRIATAAAANPRLAEAAPKAERRVALVIGNGSYTHAPSLPNAKSDAETVAAALSRVGFAEVTLRRDLDRERLNQSLKEFATLADGADWAIVYFAGHGIELGGANFLVPTDARLATDRDIPFEAVALEQVLLSVEGAKRLRLVVLDACRDNPFSKSMKRTNTTRSMGRGLARVEPEGATLLAYAARDGQVAQDGEGRNSPFVLALTKHLETPGLEISLLFRKVRDDVLAATQRRQEPFVYGSLPAEPFYFRGP